MGFLDDAKKIMNDAQSVTHHIHDGKGAKDVDLRDTIIKNPKVLAEKVLKSTALSGSITIPNQVISGGNIHYTTTTVPFYLENEFSFNVSNKWEPLLDPNSLMGSFLDMANFLNMSSGAPNVTFQSEALSSRVWKGTEFGGFNINCMFVATNRNINPVEIVKILLSTSLPTTIKDYEAQGGHGEAAVAAMKAVGNLIGDAAEAVGGFVGEKVIGAFNKDVGGKFKDAVSDGATVWKKGVKGMGMVAPLNYGIRFDQQNNDDRGEVIILPGTTVRIDIGDWFSAGQLLVQAINNVQFSKEIVAPPSTGMFDKKGPNDLYDPAPVNGKYGYPLYVKCQLSLVPAQIMTLSKFEGYFRKTPEDKVNTAGSQIQQAKSKIKKWGNILPK